MLNIYFPASSWKATFTSVIVLHIVLYAWKLVGNK